MQIGRKRIVRCKSVNEKYSLYPLGDIHLGNEACETELLYKTIKQIKDDPFALWIGLGDYCDFIGYRDARFDPTVISKALTICSLGNMGQVLSEQIIDMFTPIKTKCVGLLFGNHEDAYEIKTEQQKMHSNICAALDVQDLGYSCFVRIEFVCRDRVDHIDIRAHHGAGWATSPGGVLNRLVAFMNQSDCDLTLVGHLHQTISRRDVTFVFDGDQIDEEVRLGVMTGTFLKTYAEGITTYAEKRGYAPVVLGAPVIPLTPFGEKKLGEVR